MTKNTLVNKYRVAVKRYAKVLKIKNNVKDKVSRINKLENESTNLVRMMIHNCKDPSELLMVLKTFKISAKESLIKLGWKNTNATDTNYNMTEWRDILQSYSRELEQKMIEEAQKRARK